MTTYMDRARETSQRYLGPDGEVITEWEIYLGLRSGRINRAEQTREGYRLNGIQYTPLGEN